ncbi:TolC family protein [Porticoccaceae bacterium]|nr:TolC family protein [Porticoccaceae bacterium]
MTSLNNFKKILALLSLSVSITLQAESPSEAQALSVDQAMQYAIKTHPLILSAEGQYRAAKSELAASRWSRFPTVGASARENSFDQKQDVTTASMPLWMGGRINADIDLAKSKRDGALSGISEAQQSVMLETIGLFFDYFKSEKKLEIASLNVDEHQRLYEIIERRVEAATSPDVDAMLAQARLQSARSAQIQAASIKDISKASLELTVGRVIDAVLVNNNPEPFGISLNEAVATGIKVSPRIARIESEVKGFEANIKSAKSALYPQVSLGYEKRFNDPDSTRVDQEETFVSVQFQPGAGLAVASSISAAKLRKQSARDSLEAEKRELRRQIKTAWNEYASVSFQLEPSKMLVDATNSVIESYLRQYAVGKKSWLDVLNAQREATQARNTLVDFEVQYLTSIYRLRVLMNEINPTILGVKL